jgi:hypothetical protein
VLSSEQARAIARAAAEIDPHQIAQLAKLTPKARLKLAIGLSAEVLALAVRAERRLHPDLDLEAACKEVLRRYYQLAST